MSELTIKLRDMMTTLERPDGGAASLLLQAAVRIEELEASPANKLQSLGLNQDYEARGIEIMMLRRELSLERDKVIAARKAEDEANKIIEDIAKAAECDNFADVILARVTSQAQQSNAMTRICEGHIATARRETAKANDYLAANKELSGRIDELNSQCNKMRALLHNIADKLGAGSRSAIPGESWYLGEITKLQEKTPLSLEKDKDFLINKCAGLENEKNQAQHMLNEIAVRLSGVGSCCVNPKVPTEAWYMEKLDVIRRVMNIVVKAEAALGIEIKPVQPLWELGSEPTFVMAGWTSLADRLRDVLNIYHANKVALTKYRDFADVVGACFRNKTASIEELGGMFRGLDIAMLQAKAADAEQVKADAARRISELETALEARGHAHNDLGVNNLALRRENATHRNTIAAQNERIENLRLSELKLLDVATQIDNWQKKTETFVMDDPRDPDWAKQLNAIMCLMRRKENDATAACEAGKVTMGQLAAALGVDPSESGWHTTMLNKVEGLMRPTEQGFRIHFRNLESANVEFDKCKNRITAANARWGIKVADPTDYVKQLDYLIDEIEVRASQRERTLEDLVRLNVVVKHLEACVREEKINYEEAKKGHVAACESRDASRRELDLAVGAIKRMHANLLQNKDLTGIWPADGVFRAKLDEIEWCLNVYVSRFNEGQFQHNADTRFIADVRDSLSHEILRRNKQ